MLNASPEGNCQDKTNNNKIESHQYYISINKQGGHKNFGNLGIETAGAKDHSSFDHQSKSNNYSKQYDA